MKNCDEGYEVPHAYLSQHNDPWKNTLSMSAFRMIGANGSDIHTVCCREIIFGFAANVADLLQDEFGVGWKLVD